MTPPRYHLFTFALLALTALLPVKTHAEAGDLYVANLGSSSVVKITPSGTKIVFATGVTGAYGVAFDHADNLFVGGSDTIVKFAPGAPRSTFASAIASPKGLAVDANGNLFVAASGANAVLKFTPTGTQTTFASGLNSPSGLAFDSSGNLFVANYGSNSITKCSPSGAKGTFASGLSFPQGLAFDRLGNLYVANDGTDSVEKITPSGVRTTFVSGIGGVRGLAFDAAGNLFVSDGGLNGSYSVFKVTPAGVKSVFATTQNDPAFLAVEPARDLSVNISTRLRVQTGDNALIGGFIITGTQPKKVIVRAIGPSLSLAGVGGALQDPMLEIFNSSGASLLTNLNWKDTQSAEIEATGLAPADIREAAAVLALVPGSYTAVVRGQNNTTGVGLVEVYDLERATNSTLANISTRGFVETGDNVMIGGFILGGGNGAGKVIVRAIGPSLAQFGVAGALADPLLELYDASGTLVARNDDWKATQQAEIQSSGLPPINDHESAIVATLPSGNYTVVVKGFNNGTGAGLVEVYNLR